MNFKLSIVIPVYNNYNFTKSCIDDLMHLPEDHEIIVVDNGSTDMTKSLSYDSSRFKIIRNSSNLGFAKAVNIGYSVSSGESIMFLNNDIRVRDRKSDWTLEIINACSGNCLVGPTAGLLDHDLNFVCETNEMPSTGNTYMSGWNLTASNKTWEKLCEENELGPFRASIFFSYFEDTDLSFRAREKGIEFKIVDVPVTHFGRITGKQLNLPELYKKSRLEFLKLWSK